VHKLNYLQHREEKVAADLALIASLLTTSRQNNTIGDMGASYTSQASMKMTGRDMTATAKMAATSVLKRTARSKCKQPYRCCSTSAWLVCVNECLQAMNIDHGQTHRQIQV